LKLTAYLSVIGLECLSITAILIISSVIGACVNNVLTVYFAFCKKHTQTHANVVNKFVCFGHCTSESSCCPWPRRLLLVLSEESSPYYH